VRTRSTSWTGGLLAVLLTACSASEDVGHPVAPRTGTFENGDVALSYAIDLPPGPGPFPGVVLVHGSGRSTKEELAFLSNLLVARGIAVLRFDKRGVGGSGGVYSGVGVLNSPEMIPLLAGDVAAAVDFMVEQPGVDGERLGLVGGSQAGWIIPVAATLSPLVRFAVILVGPTVSVGLEIYFSDLVEETDLPLSDAEEQIASWSGADGFDPLPVLAQVDVPMLWLYGLVDRSIPTRACLAVHESIQAEHGFSILVYDDLGHSLASSVWSDVYPWLDEMLGNRDAASR
jgi:pimeloyl-ACP methyl ester carboxylesterase